MFLLIQTMITTILSVQKEKLRFAFTSQGSPEAETDIYFPLLLTSEPLFLTQAAQHAVKREPDSVIY